MLTLNLQDGIFLCFSAVVYYICRYHLGRKRYFPLPPGLPRWPILGNALSIPLTYAHVFYKDLGERLGECGIIKTLTKRLAHLSHLLI